MNSEWKIYTKKGDKGETSLIGGTRVPKYHERIEAYGTLDELNSFIGLVHDMTEDPNIQSYLRTIMEQIFCLESSLAAENEKAQEFIPNIEDASITIMEKEIDKMQNELPALTSFILPGGHPVVSYCHVARTITRRAERTTLRLSEKENVDEIVLKYLNRLSDYFFVLGRFLAKKHQINEIIWKPE